MKAIPHILRSALYIQIHAMQCWRVCCSLPLFLCLQILQTDAQFSLMVSHLEHGCCVLHFEFPFACLGSILRSAVVLQLPLLGNLRLHKLCKFFALICILLAPENFLLPKFQVFCHFLVQIVQPSLSSVPSALVDSQRKRAYLRFGKSLSRANALLLQSCNAALSMA